MFRKRIRHLQRYQEIVAAFTRNGFGFIMKELGLLELLSMPKRLFIEGKEINRKSVGERFRRFFEELGPTFIKIGQIASTRSDLIPVDIISELEKLQDNVPPFSYQEVQQVFLTEFGVGVEEMFSFFQERPLAAASIGQVHFAVLKTGERVAVKIQRPNIRKVIETDLEILQDIAILAERRLDWAAKYQLRDVVEEFAKSLRAEVDYSIEGRNAEKIAKQFQDDDKIYIPTVYWEYSSSKILTMEFVEGTKLNDLSKLEGKGFNRKIIAERIAHAMFQQILVDGFFHGDPHPGNLLVSSGNKVIFMDFGMVGRLSSLMRDHFASFIIAMMLQNTDGVVKSVIKMGLIPEEANLTLLRADVDLLREKYYDVPFSQLSLGEAVTDLFSVATKHGIRIPTDLTLVGKSLLTMEGIVEKLDPDLSIVKIAEPFGRHLLKERYQPKNVAARLWGNMVEYGEIVADFPKSIKEFSSIMKQGKMRVEISLSDFDRLLTRVERVSNRLSFSIVLLSFSIIMVGLIIGSSLTGHTTTLIWRLPTVEIGFAVALVMFIWLFYAIFKSGKF
ncbi:AarF/ABC1/UbiB kinase family protein [Anaerobacillus sp. CMMVII]|uniref:ABC1 kinase family protein n=1 Tax=Anaerobacillus sp. CMMVII TaxID=2755588 RepID=UPI0021B728ED|nr:AarF/ABC1/UbiB kinase family protein [Anaerobacillus sp. CMMVII]MCT8139414.1 AarF/ABC1/UbiB kinase family protein [Anaerobacillus sp. CMMVII]